MENIWTNLSAKLFPNQIFQLLWLFYFYNKSLCQFHIKPQPSILPNRILDCLQQVPNQSIREQLLAYEHKVDWSVILTDSELPEMVERAERAVAHYIPMQEKDFFKQLMDIAENNDIYQRTPDTILELLYQVFEGYSANNLLELCCGISNMGLSILHHNANITSYCGIDINAAFCDIARLRLLFENLASFTIKQEDILALHTHPPDTTYDFIIADIPRGNNHHISCEKKDFRFLHFHRKRIYSDWIYILDAVTQMSPAATAAIFLTSGALSRLNEQDLRANLIQQDMVEAVITLPANLYANTNIKTELLILKKGKSSVRCEKVLFIDISQYYYRSKRNAYTISPQGIQLVKQAYIQFQAVTSDCAIVSVPDIIANNYLLKPAAYLQPATATRMITLKEIATIIRGAQVKPDNIKTAQEGVKLINIKDIQGGNILYETADSVNEQYFATKGKFQIQPDDILITSKGTTIKMAIVQPNTPPAYISGNITLLRVNQAKYHPYILYQYLNSAEGRIELEKIQSGTTIRVLNNTNLEKYNVPFYPQDIMQSIGNQLQTQQLNYNEQLAALQKHHQDEQTRLWATLQDSVKNTEKR